MALINECSLSGLYGAGIYHASQACKAAQYAPAERKRVRIPDSNYDKVVNVKHILVSRVLLGDPQLARGTMNNLRRPAEKRAGGGVCYDSVIAAGGQAVAGWSQVHSEYITYDRTQAYPEYLLYVVEK